MGDGCGPTEIGYMYGQYKRINAHCGQLGKGLLWGGRYCKQRELGEIVLTRLTLGTT